MEYWVCDTCGKLIESEDDGWIEWIVKLDENRKPKLHHGLRLVHQNRECKYDEQKLLTEDNSMFADYHLSDVLGPNGLMLLLRMIRDRELPTEEIVEMIKRLHTPFYEQARTFLERAISEKIVELNTSSRDLCLSQLENIAKNYSAQQN